MRKKYLFILILLYVLPVLMIFSDESSDDDSYEWIKNKTIRKLAIKNSQKRQEYKSPMFLFGEINIAFLYHFDTVQGFDNDHIGYFGYKTRDFTDSKYYDDGNRGYINANPIGSFDVLGMTGNFGLKAPVIHSKNPIFSGNNIQLKLNWEFNWFQASSGFSITFTPFPFYYSEVKFNIGTGWEWLWDSNNNALFSGMGLNSRDMDAEDGFISKPLYGPVVNISLINGLQMDFSVLPTINKKYKRWMHIIVTSSAGFEYQALVNLKDDEAYHYITRDNYLNGWSFIFKAFIGYKIVIKEDKIQYKSFRRLYNRRFEILPCFSTTVWFSLSHLNDSKIEDNGWGSNFINIKLNPLLIFYLPYNYKVILFFDFRNDKRYTEETIGNLYFKDKIYNDWYMKFYTIGFIFGWEF